MKAVLTTVLKGDKEGQQAASLYVDENSAVSTECVFALWQVAPSLAS